MYLSEPTIVRKTGPLTRQPPACQTRRALGRFRITAAVIVLAVGIFLFDLWLPLGVAAGVPYVVLVLLGWWLPRKEQVIFLAFLGTLLTLIGYWVSPAGGVPWMVASNRLLAIFVIWVTAALLVFIKSSEVEILEAKEEAEKANQVKSEFLSSISHDLRTPLNAILGFADIISHQYCGPVEEKYREYADDIKASGEHLLELVNDILDLSAIEAGKQSLVKEKLSTRDILKECEKIVSNKADANGIDLSVMITDNLPPLFADRRAAKQILLNLLSNAIKFTPRGGKITLSARATQTGTILEVTDTGTGIRAEELDRLMDPFTQANANPYHTEKGWGLGLAITKSLVDLHEGTLEIQSRVKKGTTITVRMPTQAPS